VFNFGHLICIALFIVEIKRAKKVLHIGYATRVQAQYARRLCSFSFLLREILSKGVKCKAVICSLCMALLYVHSGGVRVMSRFALSRCLRRSCRRGAIFNEDFYFVP